MIGYGANKGIVPMATEEIFERISASKDAAKSFEVTVSMVEIYNEKVQDLLIHPTKRTV
jgi:Kinesin motor domain